MNRILRAAGLTALALLLGASPVTFRPASAPDFAARLSAALDEGRVDRPHAALYRLYALKAPERLPPEFRSDVPEGGAARLVQGAAKPWIQRCGTTVLRGLREGLADLPPAERAEADALLSPPVSAARQAERVAGKTVTHELPSWIVTQNFSIEWGPNLTNEDGSRPVRVDTHGVPEVVNHWASYFEAAYQAEVLDRGYHPAALDNQLIPVYLGNSVAGNSLVAIGSGTYAITNDLPVYVLVNNDFSFVPSNDDPDGRIPGAMKVTAGHEFFHVIQFLLPLPVAWDPTNDDWWLEASATWMEDEVFDYVNDYYQYFQGTNGWASLAATGLPVRSDSGDYTTKAYGNVIFAKYLSEHVAGPQAIRDVWDRIVGRNQRILDALDGFSSDRGFEGLGGLFLGFTAANTTMDYQEGVNYGSVPRPFRPLSGTFTTGLPSYLGATYHEGNGTGGNEEISLNGNPASPWGLAVWLEKPEGYGLTLGSVGSTGTASLSIGAFGVADTASASVSFLTPDSTPPPPPSGGGGGGGGGGCFVRSLERTVAALASAVTYAASTGTRYILSLAQGANPDLVPPTAPPALQVTPGPASLIVAWSAATDDRGVAGYVIGWRPTGTGGYRYRTLWGPVTSAKLGQLNGGGTYDVLVRAYDGSGNTDPVGASTTATTDAAPSTSIPAAVILQSHI